MKHLTSDCSILFSLAYSANPSYLGVVVSAKDGRGVVSESRASDADRAIDAVDTTRLLQLSLLRLARSVDEVQVHVVDVRAFLCTFGNSEELMVNADAGDRTASPAMNANGAALIICKLVYLSTILVDKNE
eukprot:scaffold6987_cov72-Cyclotella_meneghiniana.AAC.13